MQTLSRTERLIGTEAMDTLRRSHVAIFGVGGVGGYALEVIARSGVGKITIVDNDTVEPTNINRQLVALHSTIGQLKVDVAEKRIKDINPDCIVEKRATFYLPETEDTFRFEEYDFVVDCIDTVAGKASLACRCQQTGTPIISAMGAANKMDATAFRVADISETTIDPLARALRKRLRKFGVEHLTVVYSTEQPIEIDPLTNGEHPTPLSNAFVPAACGIVVGAEVIKRLISGEKRKDCKQEPFIKQ